MAIISVSIDKKTVFNQSLIERVNMIFLLLIVTKVAANIEAEADFYAIQMNANVDYYSVFTRVRNCSVYKNEYLERIFFQHDGTWKIGKANFSSNSVSNDPLTVPFDEINCENVLSFVDSKFNQPFREPFNVIFLGNLVRSFTKID